MPQGINIASTGLTGVSASIVFTPLSGAPVNIGTQTLPYFYSTANPYGSYAITVPQYNTPYTLTVPSLSSPSQDEYTAIIRGLESGSRYPNAVPVEDWGVYTKEYVRNLSGIQPSNIVYAEGICADDVDGPKVPGNIGQFGSSMTEFLGPFMSGGLAGYPFARCLISESIRTVWLVRCIVAVRVLTLPIPAARFVPVFVGSKTTLNSATHRLPSKLTLPSTVTMKRGF